MKAVLFILLLANSPAYSKDYRFYFRQIQRAEECMLNEEFVSSLKHYDSAFAQYDFKFARDCYMAAQVSAHLHEYDRTYKYLCMALEGGVRYDCLYLSGVFKDFRNSSQAKKIAEVQKELSLKANRKVDTVLNKEFSKRYALEQAVKGDKGNTYYTTLEDNFDRIHQLVSKGIFPGEKIMGLDNQFDRVKISWFTDCSYGAGFAIPTLLHYSYSFDVLAPKLVECMLQGQLSPATIVQIYIFSKYRICGYPKYKPENKKLESLPGQEEYIFNLPFEGKKTDMKTANYYRDMWYIPKMGLKHTSTSLVHKYGIAINIGEWMGDM